MGTVSSIEWLFSVFMSTGQSDPSVWNRSMKLTKGQHVKAQTKKKTVNLRQPSRHYTLCTTQLWDQSGWFCPELLRLRLSAAPFWANLASVSNMFFNLMMVLWAGVHVSMPEHVTFPMLDQLPAQARALAFYIIKATTFHGDRCGQGTARGPYVAS